MFDLLDSLIATITVVLILSLIVQSIQQIAKQLLNMKSKFMERELFAMFAHAGYKRSIIPVKFQFSKLADRFPDIREFVGKISERMHSVGYDDLSILESLKRDDFMKLVGDLVDTGEMEATDPTTITADERNRIEEKIKFLQKIRWDVEQWYDVTIKAFQDHYERRMKMWAFGMGALVVIWLNQNIFDVYKEFSHNKVLTATVVKMGEKLVEGKTDSSGGVPVSKGATLQGDTIRAELKKIGALIDNSSFNLRRWDREIPFPRNPSCFCAYTQWLWDVVSRNLFGWIGMTLLVGLGAPFWYDLLKTLVGVKEKLRGGSGGGGANGNVAALTAPSASKPAEPPAVG